MNKNQNRLVDSTFIVTVLGKGVGGLAEFLSAVTLLFFSVSDLQAGLSHFGHFGANMAHELTSGSRWFVIIYFGLRGAIRLGLAICLLLEQLWAYPAALLFLGASVVYQTYLLVAGHYSHGLLGLTIFDLVIIALTYIEWQKLKSGGHLSHPHLPRTD